MRRDKAIATLKAHEAELREVGLRGLYLFGSTARDEARDTSDVDVFFDLTRVEGFNLFRLAALKERLQEILGVSVDVMSRNAIHPRRRPRIEASAVQVF